MAEMTPEGKAASALIRTTCNAQVAKSLRTGSLLDFAWMIHLSTLLDEAIEGFFECLDMAADDPHRADKTALALVKIGTVAAILRRCDVTGTVISRD